MVAKAGLGIIGLSAISVGGVALSNPGWLGMNREIPWTPLSKDHDYETKKNGDYGSTKFGGKYKNYLTGVVGTSSQGANTNEQQWKKSFSLWDSEFKDTAKREKLGNVFKEQIADAIKPAVENGTGDKYLNTVCEEVYKQEPSNIDENGSDTGKYKEESVWKFCSPLGKKPTTIKKDYEDGTIGKTAKDRLISVENSDNDLFWKIRQLELKGGDKVEKINVSVDGNYFKTKLAEENSNIKEICRKAYETKPENGNSNPTADETKKYCSLEIS